jgi:adenosylhomocysteine nucleosidase
MAGALRSVVKKNLPILVCFALPEEAGAFRELAADKADVSILITGVGRPNAARSVREALRRHPPRRVFTAGFAGALHPALKIGEVVFLTRDPGLDQALVGAGARPASFFCAARVAVTAAEKAALRRQTGADAVEMESEVIQSICREHGIPCATVRAISDAATEDLPLDFNRLAKPDLSLDYGRLFWAVATSPGKIPSLLRLRKQCRLAAKRLAEVLQKVIALDLPPPAR